jgi:hypothetical protein
MCYKVEAVIVYKPSEDNNVNMEYGCFRTITWDNVYDNKNIHCNPHDAFGTILRDGYHNDLGKGYIYILVHEKSLKDKPISSKLLTGCNPRPTSLPLVVRDPIPSLREGTMSAMTLVDFNHFKFENKVELLEEDERDSLDDYKSLVSFPKMQKLLCLQDPNASEWFHLERTDIIKEKYRQRAFSLEELHLLTKIHSIVCMTTEESTTDKLFHAAAWKDNSQFDYHVQDCLSSHVEKFYQTVREHGFEKIDVLQEKVKDIVKSFESSLEDNSEVTLGTVPASDDNTNSQNSVDDDVILDDFLPAVQQKVAIYMNHIAKQNVNYQKKKNYYILDCCKETNS